MTLRFDDLLESLDRGASGEATVAGVGSVASSLVGGVTPGEEGVELVRTEFVFSCAHGHDHLSLAALTAAIRPSSRPSTRIRSSRRRSRKRNRGLALQPSRFPRRLACRGHAADRSGKYGP